MIVPSFRSAVPRISGGNIESTRTSIRLGAGRGTGSEPSNLLAGLAEMAGPEMWSLGIHQFIQGPLAALKEEMR
jgi:hypothetical protein